MGPGTRTGTGLRTRTGHGRRGQAKLQPHCACEQLPRLAAEWDGPWVTQRVHWTRLATGVTRDQKGLSLTELSTGRSWFLLIFRVQQERRLLSGIWYGEPLACVPSSLTFDVRRGDHPWTLDTGEFCMKRKHHDVVEDSAAEMTV